MKNKIIRIYKAVAGELAMWWMWIKNLFFVFATTKSQAKVFQGYGHWWFARKYADKRTEISKINTYCGGKHHYVLPVGEYSLAVFNSLELDDLRRKGLIKRSFTIDKVLKSAYYVAK
jgi:hypothetical protein